MPEPTRLTVVICTRDRADSLGITLQHLMDNDLDGVELDTLVVDNGSGDTTRDVVSSFEDRMAIHYLREPTPGKCHAMNRALDEGGLGEIVAFLDDDMSPAGDWCAGVLALTSRWPDCAIFSSTSYVIWPTDDVPSWAHRRGIRSWAFSVLDFHEERLLRPGEFPSGNHFWVRREAVGDRRFPDLGYMGAIEPHFILGLMDDGHAGAVAPEPRCGHRIQPGLLDLDTLRARASRIGRDLPHVRLPYPRTLPQARLAAEHPLAWRARCVLNLVRWALVYLVSGLRRGDVRITSELQARMGVANNFEALRCGRLGMQGALPAEETCSN